MTATTIGKSDVLARIDQERAWWNGLLDEIGEERMAQPGAAGDWTFKDVVAHLSGWQRRTLARLDAGRRGVEPPPLEWPAEFEAIEDEDEAVERINRWLYERNRERPVAEVVAESRRQWDELRDIIAEWSEKDLNDPARLPWQGGRGTLAENVLNGELFGHFHEEHEPAISAWMASLNP